MDKCILKRRNPNEISQLSEDSKNIIKQCGIQYDYMNVNNLVQVGPKKYIKNKFYEIYKDEIYNFPVHKNDVWVVSKGRSGSTVTQEMVWQICNDMDFEKALETPLIERFPYFEYPLINGHKKKSLLKKFENDPQKCSSIENIFTPEWEKSEHPKNRFYKTHLPISFLPHELTKNAKIVYIVRNPKDMAISLYHCLKQYGNVPKNFEDFWNLWEQGLMIDDSFFEHILEAWNIRNQENVIFLFYEMFLKDPRFTIQKLCKFFGKTYTNEQINKLIEHLNIENFKNNPSVNREYFDYCPPLVEHFINGGKYGAYLEEPFTKELNERVNDWIKKFYKRTDFRFPHAGMKIFP